MDHEQRILFPERHEEIEEFTLALLETHGVFEKGHFVGASGRHLEEYVNKRKIMVHPAVVAQLANLMVSLVHTADIEVVAAPALGAISLGHEVAKQLGPHVLTIYTEKKIDPQTGKERQLLRPEFSALVRGRRVLVIEDIVNTGGSLRELISVVKEAGGGVVGATVILNRSPETVTGATFGVPFFPLASRPMQSWAEEEVPSWLSKIPVNVTVGHGSAYLQMRA